MTPTSVSPKPLMLNYLQKYPISALGLSVGVSAQAMLWKALIETHTEFSEIPARYQCAAWWIGLIVSVIMFAAYITKTILHFEAVRCEFSHPIRYCFFFFPLMSAMILTLSVPDSMASSTSSQLRSYHPSIAYIVTILQLIWSVSTYWQYMMPQRSPRLAKQVNILFNLTHVGNFLASKILADCHLIELGKFMFTLGVVAWLLFIISLFQAITLSRINQTTAWILPSQPYGAYFLFFVPPSVASVAWTALQGNVYDDISRFFIYIAIGLFFLLIRNIVVIFRTPEVIHPLWAVTFPLVAFANAVNTYRLSLHTPLLRVASLLLFLIAFGVFVIVLLWTMRALWSNTYFIADPLLAQHYENLVDDVEKTLGTKKTKIQLFGLYVPFSPFRRVVSQNNILANMDS